MHSVVAVVLSHRAKEQASFDLARSLRAIRPDVPIVLCRDQIDSLGSCGETAVIPPGLAGKLERVSHDNYSPQFPLQLINIARLQYFWAWLENRAETGIFLYILRGIKRRHHFSIQRSNCGEMHTIPPQSPAIREKMPRQGRDRFEQILWSNHRPARAGGDA